VSVVCFVHLVSLVRFVQPNERDKPKQPVNILPGWKP
jgi:hypothetical protein